MDHGPRPQSDNSRNINYYTMTTTGSSGSTLDAIMEDVTVESTDAVAVPRPAEDKENRKTSSDGYRAPWVELYRPRTLDDVLGNEDTVLRLRAIAKDGNMPNLILCGPPGTGMSTASVSTTKNNDGVSSF